MQWYYAKDGQQVGPVSDEDLQSLIASGDVTDATLVWHEGMTDWAAYGSLAGAGAVAEAASPPVEAGPEPVTCSECGRSFPPDEVIQYEGTSICAACKPAFFQRLQEGAPPSKGGGEGKTPNAEIMAEARQRLSGNWGTAIGVCLVFWLISMAISVVGSTVGSFIPFAGNVVQLLLVPPLTLGVVYFFVALTSGGQPDFALLFSGFHRYGTTIGAYFFRQLIVGVVVLVTLLPSIICFIVGVSQEMTILYVIGGLLAIPGFVATFIISYMFAQTFFVLAEDDTCTWSDALKRSRDMMKGMKWKYFCLNMRFFGWAVLAMLTFFVGFIWLAPYMATSFAIFYHDVKGRTWLVQ